LEVNIINTMKKLLTILAVVFFAAPTWAQTTEYLQQKDFKVEKQKIYEGINASRKQLNDIKKGDLKMERNLDSLKRILSNYSMQLGTATDSLSKTSVKLNALQEKVDNEKFLSRGLRIMIIVILILMFIILFALMFRFKRSAELNHQYLIELDKKTNDRIELEMKNFKTELQNCRDIIGKNANEINLRISTGLNSLETRNNQLEKQFQENLAGIEGKIGSIGPEIKNLKEEQSKALKSLEGKFIALKQETENRNQVLTTQAAKLEEEVRLVKGRG
jgi:hypothetical protein